MKSKLFKNIQFISVVVFTVILFVIIELNISCDILIKDTLSVIAEIATISGMFGIVFAVYKYHADRKDNRRQILIALKSQLNVIGLWTNYEGNGYSVSKINQISEENKIAWMNPFHRVFDTDATAIQNIWQLDGIELLPNHIIEKIAPLNQIILSFNNYLKQINGFCLSIDPVVAVKINIKLNSSTELSKIHALLSRDESSMCTQLLNMYITLHFTIIGDSTNGSLHKQHKELLDLVKQSLGEEL